MSESLAPSEKGVRLCVGVSGSGKSHSCKLDGHAAARKGMRIVVVDSMEEWTKDEGGRVLVNAPPDIARRVLRMPWSKASTQHIRETFLNKSDIRIIVLNEIDTEAQCIAATERACAWAIQDPDKVRGVIVHEAWQVAPSHGRLSPSLAKVIRAWRHKGVALWLDSQRLVMISRNVTELAREVRMFAMTGDRDFKIAIDIAGPDIEPAIRECAKRYKAGQPGWHVVLGAMRVGPYEIRRSGR